MFPASFSADFDEEGRLLTTSYDGSVRIYDPQGKAQYSAQPQAGKRAQEARFSPDGSKVAVGFADASDVSVFSGKDMAFIRGVDLFGLAEGVFQAITWSRDGNQLVGAGTAQTPTYTVAPPRKTDEPKARAVNQIGSSYVVRAWSKGGTGEFVDFKPPVTDAILDVATTPDGSIVYASADASWGVISSKGELTKEYVPATAQFQGMRMRLSPDGKAVRFAYRRGGRDLASFDASELKLSPTPPQTTRWLAPDEKKESGSTPKPPAKKLPLPMGPREVVRAVASGSNDSFFVFGTDIAVRCVDLKGTVRWELTVPAPVRAVNVSSDDKLAVVAFADGTIRWHRASDGTPLLTLFPHVDGKRWVAYTPSGYFADSPKGDDLVRFVMNATPDKLAIESSAAANKARFFRPDVVSRILDTLDEAKAVDEADAARKAGQH